MIKNHFKRCHPGLLLILSILFFSACTPVVYKKPAQDFHTASVSLRDAYFSEWTMSNQARIESGDIEDQIALLTAPADAGKSELERVSEKMAERRSRDIHEQLRPLRIQAFCALEVYASTLVSLASDEPTQRIQSELSGLVTDINHTVEAVEALGLLDEAMEQAAAFTGPLGDYIKVLNHLIGIISDILRERAIIETIGQSNDSIVDLINILKDEAKSARENTLGKTREAIEDLDRFISHKKFDEADNETRLSVLKRKAELVALSRKIEQIDIAAVFASALDAQAALVKKAMVTDPGDWALRIRQFRKKAMDTKTEIDSLKPIF